MLFRGLPGDALIKTPTGKGRWDDTHELLARLIEEVSLLTTEPRFVREKPVTIDRPWDTPAVNVPQGRKAAEPTGEPEYKPDGGVVAVGAVAAMKAMGGMTGPAIRYAPGPVAETGGGSE